MIPSYRRKPGCPGCACWGNDVPEKLCTYCELIRPAAELFGWSVVRIVAYSETKLSKNKRVRDMARVRGVKPQEIVDAILAVLDAHRFDEYRERLDALRSHAGLRRYVTEHGGY